MGMPDALAPHYLMWNSGGDSRSVYLGIQFYETRLARLVSGSQSCIIAVSSSLVSAIVFVCATLNFMSSRNRLIIRRSL